MAVTPSLELESAIHRINHYPADKYLGNKYISILISILGNKYLSNKYLSDDQTQPFEIVLSYSVFHVKVKFCVAAKQVTSSVVRAT